MVVLTPTYKSIRQTIRINGRRMVLPPLFTDIIDERNGYNYPISLFLSLQVYSSQTRNLPFIVLYDFQMNNSPSLEKIQINQRKIILPEKATKHASLEDEVTIIGVDNHMELWHPKNYHAYENLQAIKPRLIVP